MNGAPRRLNGGKHLRRNETLVDQLGQQALFQEEIGLLRQIGDATPIPCSTELIRHLGRGVAADSILLITTFETFKNSRTPLSWPKSIIGFVNVQHNKGHTLYFL